ncbi:uncharacterized protein LOC134197285 [Corticium candelabrum]|uniref:uncharacterized protein LOC134197285 n=1 Tax=Corticium candelabrum TaxID=121492 RepID=UPI002E25B0C4|nr:uncharacterized protein LOC134197285 [Corticium candelabrum]
MANTRDFLYPFLQTIIFEAVAFLVIDIIVKENLKRSQTARRKKRLLAAEGCLFLLVSLIAILSGRIPIIMLTTGIGCIITSASSFRETHKDVERTFLRKVEKSPVGAILSHHQGRTEKAKNVIKSPIVTPETELGLGSEYTETRLSRRPLRSRNQADPRVRPLAGIPEDMGNTPKRHRSDSFLSETQEEMEDVRDRSQSVKTATVWSVPWWHRYGISTLFNYQAHHPPGISNRSTNTCFLNACLQCVARAPGFLTRIPLNDKPRCTTESVVYYLHKLMQQLLLPKEKWTFGHLCTETFRRFAHSLRPDFIASPENGYQKQNDAGEFLIWLLNTVHETVKISCPRDAADVNTKADVNINFTDDSQIIHLCRSLQNGHKYRENILDALVNACNERLNSLGRESANSYHLAVRLLVASEWALYSMRNNSVVTSLFTGQLLEKRKCLSCQRISVSAEAFVLLPVPVVSSNAGGVPRLMDCLMRFGQLEVLGPQERLRCPCNELQSASNGVMKWCGNRQAFFSMLPECLNIQLQRFSYNIHARVVEKNHTPVDFPLDNLDLSDLTLNNFVQTKPSQHCLYSLYGVCVHLGSHSASCGHYVAYCLCDEDGKWYRFDDEVVREADMEAEKLNRTLRENAYILFYKRKS